MHKIQTRTRPYKKVEHIAFLSTVLCFILAPFYGQSSTQIDYGQASTETFSLEDRGGTSLSSQESGGSVSVGYARMIPDDGDLTPSGIAVFGFKQGGVLVSEASVPATSPIYSGRILAHVDGAISTGIAFVNANESDATISFYFTDDTGTNFGANSFVLPAKQHTAKFLNQAPFNSGSSLLGTFTFSANVPVSVIALRGYTTSRSDFLITTLPVVSITSISNNNTIFFPQFADGGGWTTDVILINPTDTTISGTIQFAGSGSTTAAAEPAVLSLTNGKSGSQFDYYIPPRTSRLIQTANPATVKVGSVRVVPDSWSTSPAGLAVFSFRKGGIVVSEAGVPASTEGTAFRVYVEASGTPGQVGSIRSGLAITNISNADATITLDLTTTDGVATGTTASLTIPQSGQVAKFIDELFSTLTNPFSGVLRVTSGNSKIAMVGLRGRTNERGDFLLTTTPPTNEASSTTTTALYFPHIADSGGWTTQFILFSGVPGLAAAGKLYFTNQQGMEWGLPVGQFSGEAKMTEADRWIIPGKAGQNLKVKVQAVVGNVEPLISLTSPSKREIYLSEEGKEGIISETGNYILSIGMPVRRQDDTPTVPSFIKDYDVTTKYTLSVTGSPQSAIRLQDPCAVNPSLSFSPRPHVVNLSETEQTASMGTWVNKISAVDPVYIYPDNYDTCVVADIQESIDLARQAWGNYGPLIVYIIGPDNRTNKKLAEQWCTLHSPLFGQGPGSPYENISSVADCVAVTDATGDFHKMTPPPEVGPNTTSADGGGTWILGYADIRHFNPLATHLRVSNSLGAGFRKIMIHEYFHVYQGSRWWDGQRSGEAEQNDDTASGPFWMEEGAAEYFAFLLMHRKGWLTLKDIMKEYQKIYSQDVLAQWPDKSIDDLESSMDVDRLKPLMGDRWNLIQYHMGSWAVAYLIHLTSEQTFFNYYDDLDALGWRPSFKKHYGMTPDEFYVKYNDFIKLPIDQQLLILP